jgi:hypothetical protein
MMNPTALRHQLLAAGYCPLPLRGKAPFQKDWQKRIAPSAADIDNWSLHYPDACNTGGLCRNMPTLDLDILDPDAAAAVEALVRERFEERGCILVRFGRAPKRAIPFRTDTPFPKIVGKIIAPDGSTDQKIEMLGDGQQIVVDGLHPDTKKPYGWHGGAPGAIRFAELPLLNAEEARALIEAAVDLLVRDFGYVRPQAKQPAGNGFDQERTDWAEEINNILVGSDLHDSITRLAAKLIASGMSAGAAANLLRDLLQRSNAPRGQRFDDRLADIPRAVDSALRKYQPDQTAARAAAASATPARELFDPWERYIVPEFPLQVLPPVVLNYVTSQSVVIGCDCNALAMAALTAISGALDHRFAVKMMRNGNWWEHPRLWTLLVGDPSRKKTPVVNDVTRPLERHEAELRRDYEARLLDYEAAKEAGDAGVKKPAPPVRYVVWDATTEKLGEILSRSEHGLLVKRDEFSGWIGGMEKYSNASRGTAADRGFWLQAYDGGPHAVDRVSRGEIYIGNLSVSLIGGIQPARLAELQGLTSDGLLQRFLPVMMRASRLPLDRAGDDWENYHALAYKLIRAKHQRLFLSDTALEALNELRARLHQLEQAAGGLTDGLQAFIGKLPGIAGRLAVILHLAANPESAAREIEAETVADVCTLILDFIVPHAVEFYRSTEELTGGERLRKIASWIVTSRQRTITSRDLVRNVSCLRGMPLFDLQTLVSPLVAAGWLEPEQRDPQNRSWTVSPSVASQFERRCQIEEERKALAAELMGSPRKSPP